MHSGISFYLFPGCINQWPYVFTSDRRYTAQAAKPCASQKPHYHCLCLVIHSMPCCYPVCIISICSLFKKSIPRLPCHILQRLAFPGKRRNIHFSANALNAKPLCNFLYKPFIPVRFSASHTMIEMRNNERKFAFFRKPCQHVQQRNRIYTAGDADDNSVSLA